MPVNLSDRASNMGDAASTMQNAPLREHSRSGVAPASGGDRVV